jgi:hypothetical protein
VIVYVGIAASIFSMKLVQYTRTADKERENNRSVRREICTLIEEIQERKSRRKSASQKGGY